MNTPSARLPDQTDPPPAAAVQLARDGICERIARAAPVKLILVCAPAGYGKTSAMTQVCTRFEAEGIDTAWLTLDAADNDASRIVARLAAAMEKITRDDVSHAAPTELLRRLTTHDAPYAIFLDDFERIQEPAVLGLVHELLEQLPREGRLVIGARTQPDLGLSRLRARGQLLDIDIEDLRLSLPDTERYFALLPQLQLTAQAVQQLHRKTEGWVAALSLAATALRRQPRDNAFIEGFSGSHHSITRYLAEAVFSQQNEATRQFLLRTSILRKLEISLCNELVPGCDSRLMLEGLETHNLFVTPLPGRESEQQAWRYHSLFNDFLRTRLAEEEPERVARLHLAASGWYETRGCMVAALDHAIEGGDLLHAASLLVRHVEFFIEHGRLRLLARWLAALPSQLVAGEPLLRVAAIWADCFTRGPSQALARLEASACEHSDLPAVRSHAAALRPLLLAMMDRFDEALAAGRQSIERWPGERGFAATVRTNTLACVRALVDEPAQSHRMLDVARQASQDDRLTTRFTESMQGILDLQEGRVRQAAARFRIAAGEAYGAGRHYAHGNAWAGVLYAGTVYESGQLDQALHLLNVYNPLVRDIALPDHIIISRALRSRIAFQQGDVDGAQAALAELEYLGHHRELPRVVATARLERARMLSMQGHGLAALEALGRADSPGLWERVRTLRLPWHDIDDLAIGRLRWEIAFGKATAALPQLAAEAAAAAQSGRRRRVLKLRVLQALARYRSGDITGALQTGQIALREACGNGFVRLILDEGAALAPLLQRQYRDLQEQPGRGDPILGDYLLRLLHGLGASASQHETRETDGDRAGGSLTRQEVRILQLLADGYSNGAMVEKLCISDSTVRTHLRSINLKLGAHSRIQAIAAARRLAVIR
ncbi:LuxR C-terminal-related transcriptional regulator [Burkholderia alba]|uniref:LuxR C-terminal-related transcriptional regulator n=1 Tax=Burkholderia alba TaxID=2683677 RepID=UPI002B059E17|nr:LuxR C-terminal-related transcriptional regulator [Burkholderia alba]